MTGRATPDASDHAARSHLDAHAAPSHDDHGHGEPVLGPIDWAAWAYAIVGVGAALVVVLALWIAVS